MELTATYYHRSMGAERICAVMAKILVSGGDFERTDGFLAFIDLNGKNR